MIKIVSIFASSLYAMHYEGEEQNEYIRLMYLWMDLSYLQQYAKDNNIKDRKAFVEEIPEDAESIQDFMDAVEEGEVALDAFFRPLDNMESGFKELSLQKGKSRRGSHLRLYAIRIDEETYVITGGAIKLVFTMQESEDLMEEKRKLEFAKAYLQSEGVFDKDSFQEFKTGQDER